MKKIINDLTIILLFTIFITSCGDNTTKSNSLELSERKTPLTKDEITGNYQGTYTDSELGYNTAAKIKVNKDGNFIANIFINGKELTDNGVSPLEGTYTIGFEKNEIKNPYGEVTGYNCIHKIDFNANTRWGVRTSTYIIEDGLKLIPISSFIDDNIIFERASE